MSEQKKPQPPARPGPSQTPSKPSQDPTVIKSNRDHGGPIVTRNVAPPPPPPTPKR
ncbi:hypothetical protein QF021_000260 [Acidovorax delafieldii]|nr:hypothetical protein [Acidovorax delafieldii]